MPSEGHNTGLGLTKGTTSAEHTAPNCKDVYHNVLFIYQELRKKGSTPLYPTLSNYNHYVHRFGLYKSREKVAGLQFGAPVLHVHVLKLEAEASGSGPRLCQSCPDSAHGDDRVRGLLYRTMPYRVESGHPAGGAIGR